MENTCFRDPAWLQYNPLTAQTVLSYFAFSQFYDRNCNNEVLKMQAAYSALASIDGLLKKMTGVQYAVHEAQEPHLFVIKKCERHAPDRESVLEYYYVIHGTVYQAPTEKEVARTRYTNIMFSLMSTLDNLPFIKTKKRASRGSRASRGRRGQAHRASRGCSGSTTRTT